MFLKTQKVLQSVQRHQCHSNIDDYSQSTRQLTACTLRNILGTKKLGDILSDRDQIAGMMQEVLDKATDPWGVKVERV